MKTVLHRLSSSRSLSNSLCKLFLTAALLGLTALPAAAQEKLTIAACGGGSGPLSDTLAAITMTAVSEVEFIELNLAVTSDEELIVYSGTTLEAFTDVQELFPDRSRQDGSYPVTDFTLQEIRQLRRTTTVESGASDAPPPPALGIASLKEVLALLKVIEHQRQSTVGILPRVASAAAYKKAGKDISGLLVAVLAAFDYHTGQAVMIESDDTDELQRIKEELLPTYGMEIPLVQRIDTPASGSNRTAPFNFSPDNSWLFTHLGLRMVSSYASALILPEDYLQQGRPSPLPSGFIHDAKALGLDLFVTVTPAASTKLPEFTDSQDALLGYYYNELGLDGVLTTEPGNALGYFARLAAQNAEELERRKAQAQLSPLSVYLQRQALEQPDSAPSATTNL